MNKLKFKILCKIKKPACRQAGMSYVELIVVLSIFATLSSVVMFNYGDFQDRVDIKNLASDIALKVVEAQKSSINGVLPIQYNPTDPMWLTWKPSYGIYFDATNIATTPLKSFYYFTDFNNTYLYNPAENITKNNYISNIDVCSASTCASGSGPINNPFSIIFKRPDSRANFVGATINASQYLQITVKSPKSNEAKALIKIYPSGRVQVN
jgi:type II secretory pathway pseudopilin PulG